MKFNSKMEVECVRCGYIIAKKKGWMLYRCDKCGCLFQAPQKKENEEENESRR